MALSKRPRWISAAFCLFAAAFLLLRFIPAQAQVGAYDLIGLINGQRAANGLSPLSVDSALMACAQWTAETMAASHMTWHIGNVSGRASLYGYNGGGTCFATENFMMGSSSTSISQIASTWADATHMIPSTNGKYVNVGAGVATGADGSVYYVLQAAYPAGKPGSGAAVSGSGTGVVDISQIIKSVVVATADPSGEIWHEVQDGQTLWAIATAYKVNIQDIMGWNNLTENAVLSLGQKLYIPDKEKAGMTPTPQTELTVMPTADAQGKYKHTVKEGETLWSISELWKVSLNALYQANGLNEQSSIGLDWELDIPVTATVTPIPTETPLPTPTPEDTPTPSPTPETSELSLEMTETPEAKPSETIGHLPEADPRTYVILGSAAALLCGGGLVIFAGKKRKKK